LKKSNESPDEIKGAGACWTWSFEKDKIDNALDGY
jgi:hypothetical protein